MARQDQQLTVEQWKPVVGYEGLYEVSDHGRVRSLHQWRQTGSGDRIVAQKIQRNGQSVVCLARSRCKKYPLVHRLVLIAFVGECPAGCEGAHNNGNAQDNHITNLRWDTHWNNMQDKHSHGTCYKPKGELHHNRKLSNSAVLEIVRSSLSENALADKFCVHPATIHDVLIGRTWSHVTGKLYQRRSV